MLKIYSSAGLEIKFQPPAVSSLAFMRQRPLCIASEEGNHGRTRRMAPVSSGGQVCRANIDGVRYDALAAMHKALTSR